MQIEKVSFFEEEYTNFYGEKKNIKKNYIGITGFTEKHGIRHKNDKKEYIYNSRFLNNDADIEPTINYWKNEINDDIARSFNTLIESTKLYKNDIILSSIDTKIHTDYYIMHLNFQVNIYDRNTGSKMTCCIDSRKMIYSTYKSRLKEAFGYDIDIFDDININSLLIQYL